MFLPQNEMKLLHVMEVLTNAAVVIILQYINLSNQPIGVYLKLIQCNIFIISQLKIIYLCIYLFLKLFEWQL